MTVLKGFGPLGLILLILVSCSKGPEQYPAENPPEQDQVLEFSNYINLDEMFEGAFISPLKVTRDEGSIAKENSKKDIVYGVGAAGITFDTTQNESLVLLSDPVVVTDDNIGVYNEGMYVFWRTQDPTVPTLIWLTKDYLGKLRVGGEIGDLKMGGDLSSFFSESSPQGENFINILYRTLEKMPTDFDCLKEKICQIKDFETYYLYISPKMMILVSKDRHLIADMRLKNNTEKGFLDNKFDILSEVILVPEEEGREITLGQTWEELEENIGKKGLTNVTRTSFYKNFGGIYLVLSKSSYDRDYKGPKGYEVLKSLYFSTGFEKEFVIGGKSILLNTPTDGPAFFKLAEEGLLEENKPKLKLKMGLKGSQESMVSSLTDIIYEEIKKKNPKNLIFKTLSGFYNEAKEKDLTGFILNMATDRKSASYVSFELANSTGNFNSLEVSRITDPINQMVMKELDKDVVFKTSENQKLSSLSGYSLGQVLTVENIDKGREEADLVYNIGEEVNRSRIYFNPKGILYGMYGTDGKSIPHSVSVITTGDLPVTLYMVPKKDSADKFIVTGIRSTQIYAEVNGLCDLTLPLKIGISTKEYRNSFRKAHVKKTSEDSSFECNFQNKISTDGNGELFKVYFPDHKAAINFEDKELTSITIYTRPSEVQ